MFDNKSVDLSTTMLTFSQLDLYEQTSGNTGNVQAGNDTFHG